MEVRRWRALAALVLAFVLGGCGGDDADLGEPSTGSTTTDAPATATVSSTTATTEVASVGLRPEGLDADQSAAIDVYERFVELRDRAYAEGIGAVEAELAEVATTDQVEVVRGLTNIVGTVERTSVVRVDRIWAEGDGHMFDACVMVASADGDDRITELVTVSPGPVVSKTEQIAVTSIDNDGCPPTALIGEVTEAYTEFRSLYSAARADPPGDTRQLRAVLDSELEQLLLQYLDALVADKQYELNDPALGAEVVAYAPAESRALVVDCHEVEAGRGIYDAATRTTSSTSPIGQVEQLSALLTRADDGRWTVDTFGPDRGAPWCEQRHLP